MHHLPDPTTPTHSRNVFRSGALVHRLIRRSSLEPGDLVLDLGAGTGVIAERLARAGCEVVAVERDPALAERLRTRFSRVSHVHVRECDVLDFRFPRGPYKVFSNIPFDLTARIVARLTHAHCPPEDAYLVVQHEAAERFMGRPRTTLAAALLFPWFEATRFHEFRRTDFAPVPRIEVVMLRLRKRGPPLVTAAHAQLYRDFAVRLSTGAGASVRDRLAPLLGKQRARRLASRLALGDACPSRIGPEAWLELFNASVSLSGDELRWRVAHAERWLGEQHGHLQKVHRTRARRLRPPPRLSYGPKVGRISPGAIHLRVGCSA